MCLRYENLISNITFVAFKLHLLSAAIMQSRGILFISRGGVINLHFPAVLCITARESEGCEFFLFLGKVPPVSWDS